MTLIELLWTLGILAFVMSAIVGVFVSGLHAEVDMNQRFQAQQDARLALSSLRNEVGSACSETVYTSAGVPAANGAAGKILTLGEGCTDGVSSTTVTWCADSSAGAPYSLYRQTGTSCTYNGGGITKAGSLTTNLVFTKLAPSGQRPQLQATFPVDANLAKAGGAYTLSDTIMLRNAAVS